MKNTIGYILVAIFLVYLLADKCDKDLRDKVNSEPKKQISCMVCGKDLTDDYNRIAPNGHDAYYCTPCYKATMRDVNESIKAEGY